MPDFPPIIKYPDVKSDMQSVNAGESLSIQPPAGEEWEITQIYHASDVELRLVKGTDEIAFDSDVGAGVWLKTSLKATNTVYFKVKNTTGSPALIGYDGVRTK